MENILISWFGDFTLLVIPLFAGIVCSFLVEAANQITPPTIKGSYLAAGICLVVGVFLAFGFPKVVNGWVDQALIILMNWAFAVLFYKIGGKIVVEKIVGKALRVVSNKTDE